MMPTRIVYLDYIRVLACILVVVIHAPMPDGQGGIVLSAFNYLSAPCIGLFFMTSGALLFPTKGTIGSFLKKRSDRILFPLIVWSVFYLVVKVIAGKIALEDVGGVLIKSLYSSSIEGVLWFLYSLIGLYLFAPILSKWIESASQRDLHYFLLMWAVTLLFPYLEISAPFFLHFSGYMGYMVLGYYLNKYPLRIPKLHWIGITGLLSIVFPMMIYMKVIDFVDNREVYGYLTINVAWLSVCYFSLIQNFKFKERGWCTEISTLSFGIYLVHIYVMRFWVWNVLMMFERTPSYIEIPLATILTLGLSYCVVKILSLFKFSKYIIGV